jgi:hypothetical protein
MLALAHSRAKYTNAARGFIRKPDTKPCRELPAADFTFFFDKLKSPRSVEGVSEIGLVSRKFSSKDQRNYRRRRDVLSAFFIEQCHISAKRLIETANRIP